MTIRDVMLRSIPMLLAALAVLFLLASPAPADPLAGSGGVVVPDVGAAPAPTHDLAGSGGTVVPDVGAAPFERLLLAGSTGTVVPDVG